MKRYPLSLCFREFSGQCRPNHININLGRYDDASRVRKLPSQMQKSPLGRYQRARTAQKQKEKYRPKARKLRLGRYVEMTTTKILPSQIRKYPFGTV